MRSMSGSLERQDSGGVALPASHITGERRAFVSCRSTTMRCATGSARMLGSSTDTDAMTVGSASEAQMAVNQTQRVLRLPSRRARSANQAPIDNISVTMTT
jgi:hypothetical protein